MLTITNRNFFMSFVFNYEILKPQKNPVFLFKLYLGWVWSWYTNSYIYSILQFCYNLVFKSSLQSCKYASVWYDNLDADYYNCSKWLKVNLIALQFIICKDNSIIITFTYLITSPGSKDFIFLIIILVGIILVTTKYCQKKIVK